MYCVYGVATSYVSYVCEGTGEMNEVDNDRRLKREGITRSLAQGSLLKTHNCYKQLGCTIYNDEKREKSKKKTPKSTGSVIAKWT